VRKIQKFAWWLSYFFVFLGPNSPTPKARRLIRVSSFRFAPRTFSKKSRVITSCTFFSRPQNIIWKLIDPTHPFSPPKFPPPKNHPDSRFWECCGLGFFGRSRSKKTKPKAEWNAVNQFFVLSENCQKISKVNSQIWIFFKHFKCKGTFCQIYGVPCCLPHPGMFLLAL